MDIKARLLLLVIGLLSLLTIRGAHRLARFLGWYMRVSNSSAYQVTQKNLELCYPDKSDDEREALARESLYHAGCIIAETGITWGGTQRRREANRRLIKGMVNEHLFFDALKKEKGVLILSSHYGNWEFFASALPQHCDLMALYKEAKLPLLEQRMLEARKESGLKLVAAGRVGVQKFMAHYKANKACLILPDQEPSPKSGIWSSFFGVPALTPKFIHYLIKKNPEGVVLCCHVKRLDDGYEVIFSDVHPDVYSNDMGESVAAMNTTFEHRINDDGPEQYQWNYKRFKKNPEKFYK